MAAFTEEQMKILEAMFDHMWTRMASQHDYLSEDSTRIGALGQLLVKQKLFTPAQLDAAMKNVDMDVKESRALYKPQSTEQEITRRILRGGTWEG
jgi:aspartate aminotransferase-like enzyme